MLELHIPPHPPSFSLPASEPAALFLLALLHRSLPPASWRPVVDTTVSAIPHLPFLLDLSTSRPRRISTLPLVLAHLHNDPNFRDQDSHLSPRQHADSTALAAHLFVTTLPLVDSALYTHPHTPTVTPLLPWGSRPFYLRMRRDIARSRADTLGLDPDPNSELNNEPSHTERGATAAGEGVGMDGLTTRDSLIARRLGRAPLARGVAAAAQKGRVAVRRTALVRAALEPAEAMLFPTSGSEDGRRVLGTYTSSTADILLAAHVCVMIAAGEWLAECVREGHPRLAEWAEERRREFWPTDEAEFEAVMAVLRERRRGAEERKGSENSKPPLPPSQSRPPLQHREYSGVGLLGLATPSPEASPPSTPAPDPVLDHEHKTEDEPLHPPFPPPWATTTSTSTAPFTRNATDFATGSLLLVPGLRHLHILFTTLLPFASTSTTASPPLPLAFLLHPSPTGTLSRLLALTMAGMAGAGWWWAGVGAELKRLGAGAHVFFPVGREGGGVGAGEAGDLLRGVIGGR